MKVCAPDLLVTTNAAGAGDTPGSTPNDALLPKQWAMDAINASAAWQAGAFGQVHTGAATGVSPLRRACHLASADKC